MNQVTLTLTKGQHEKLRAHLFPPDGCEAVAILLCARRAGSERQRLLTRRIITIPYAACTERTPNRVSWPTDQLPELLAEAASKDWAVVKIHGHLSHGDFSKWDDASDAALFPSVRGWTDSDGPHASMIMLPSGEIFGRAFQGESTVTKLSQVAVIGDDIRIWGKGTDRTTVPEYGRRIAQSFGKGTFELLKGLKIGVVGCSGTGSPVIEQLARNGVGKLVLVDPDIIEEKNLNRILNSTRADARAATHKVTVANRMIEALEFGTSVETFATTLFDPNVVRVLADCDVLFGCMDTIDGRHLLNKLATFYLIPYFDLGVKIEADGKGGVEQVCGSVHYLKPDGSSLLSRGVYTMEQVRAAGLARTDPENYRELLAQGYLRGVAEDRPAVIQLNMLIASLAVNEMLARLHPYRIDPSVEYAVHRISLSHGIFTHENDGEPCAALARHAGRGDVKPLLDWPELSEAPNS